MLYWCHLLLRNAGYAFELLNESSETPFFQFGCFIYFFAQPKQRRLKQRHIFHPNLNPAGKLSSSLLLKRLFGGF